MTQFDPAEVVAGTVAEVEEWAQDATVEQIQAVLDYESAMGQDRVTLVRALSAMVDPVPEEPASPQAAAFAEPRTYRNPPVSFTVTRDCSIEGTDYTRGDVLGLAETAAFRKLDVLLSNRTIIPTPDPYGRKTDLNGFGATPRKHPTPTHYSPNEVQVLLDSGL